VLEKLLSKDLNELYDELDEISEKIQESDMKKGRKFYQLTEEQLKGVIQNLVSENAIPGLTVTKKAQKQSKKDNDANAKEVAKKIKKATGVKDVPEFPKANGGDKNLRKNSKEEQEYVDENGNRNPLDLEYDSEPSEQFKDRQKKALEGDSTMGNGVEDGSNAIKTDTGKDMAKTSNKKKKAKDDEPIYKKEAVPVSENKDEKEKIINEEIKRLKDLYNYNKKTQ
jgi:hypothetical protein